MDAGMTTHERDKWLPYVKEVLNGVKDRSLSGLAGIGEVVWKRLRRAVGLPLDLAPSAMPALPRRRSGVKEQSVEMCNIITLPLGGRAVAHSGPTGLGRGSRRRVQFCIVNDQLDVQTFKDKIFKEEWHLDKYRAELFLSVNGGARDMNLDDERYKKAFDDIQQVFAGAARKISSLVSTGGNDCGAMALIGRSLSRHDELRTVPCIGIGSFGGLQYEIRTQLRQALNRDAEEDKTSDNDILAGLDPYHTHFVFVNKEEAEEDENARERRPVRGANAFGKELKWREEMEHMLGIDRVMIMVNGGNNTILAAWHAYEKGCSIVTCQGSGRAADFLAKLKMWNDRKDLEEQDILAEAGKEWDKLVTAGGAPIPRDSNILGLDITFAHLVRELSGYSRMDVYSSECRDCRRLEDVILSAWSGVSGHASNIDEPQVDRYLKFAVQWGCSEEQYRRLEKVTDIHNKLNIEGVLCNFVREWRRYDSGPLMEWLLNRELPNLSQKVSEPEFFNELTKKLNEHTKKLTENKDVEGVGHEGHWSGKPWLLPPNGVDHRLDHLYLWLVENGAHDSVVDTVWLRLEEPVHAALAAAGLCRGAAGEHHAWDKFDDQEERKRLTEAADRLEGLAVSLLGKLDVYGHLINIRAQEYMERSSSTYLKHTLVSLAPRAECGQFVLQGAYFRAIERQMTRVGDKARWHWASRIIFTLFYSWVLLASRNKLSFMGTFARFLSTPEDVSLNGCYLLWVILLFSVLIAWGVSSLYIERSQYRAQPNWGAYCNVWNFLDVLLISLLLVLSFCTVFHLVVIGMGFAGAWITWLLDLCYLGHAGCLLVAYLRWLQIAEWWEEPGVLLSSLFDLVRKHGRRFLLLLVVVSVAFSCPITLILCKGTRKEEEKVKTDLLSILCNGTRKEAEKVEIPGLPAWTDLLSILCNGTKTEEEPGQLAWTDLLSSVLEGFWAVFGDSDPWKDDPCEAPDSALAKAFASILKFVHALTSNVLIVNGLLIALLTSQFEKARESSRRRWALRRADAVLEFASETMPTWPPPLDLVFGQATKVEILELKETDKDLAITFRLKGRQLQMEHVKASRLLEMKPELRQTAGVEGAAGDARVAEEHSPEIVSWNPVAHVKFKDVPQDKSLMLRYGPKDGGYEPVPIIEKGLDPIQRDQIAQLQRKVFNEEEERKSKGEPAAADMA